MNIYIIQVQIFKNEVFIIRHIRNDQYLKVSMSILNITIFGF